MSFGEIPAVAYIYLCSFAIFIACLEDAKEKGLIYAAGVWQKDEVKRTRYMNEAYVMGKNV